MVSQDSSSDPASSILHQFIISSDPISSRTNMEDNGYTSFQSDGRNRNSFPQSLGVLPTTQLLGERISRAIDQLQAHTISEDSEPCSRRHLMNLLGAARETDSDHQAQRLCLTLGSHLPSHMLIPSLQYRQRPLHSDPIGFNYLISGEESREIHSPGLDHTRNDYPFADSIYTSSSTVQNQACSTSYEIESFANVVANSRYLKPAQSLLEEVVSVGGKDIDFSSEKPFKRLARNGRRGTLGVSPEMQAEVCSNALAAEKQELQIRIVKLTALLDEVLTRLLEIFFFSN
uniref:POX domain-containing protein n=1 Tax=Nelumbo nucifera TaxID=4432 RepID=A0A822XY35_NELNU|nr:TPA_asm: hypothetical protein HUJ06_023761 [Nelumbo nucifera]